MWEMFLNRGAGSERRLAGIDKADPDSLMFW